jgi:YVTN family beta-propeller protein
MAAQVYVANSSDNTVSVIDASSNVVVDTISVSAGAASSPVGIAFDPAGARAYLTYLYGNTLAVLDAVSGRLAAAVTFFGTSQCTGIVASRAAPRVYVAHTLDRAVEVLDTRSNTLVAPIMDGQAYALAINSAGTRVYVASPDPAQGSGSVAVIDTATSLVLATVPVGIGPEGIAISPDGARIYVTNTFSADNVMVIDTSSNAVVSSLRTGAGPRGIALDGTGRRAYVANGTDNTVAVIDTRRNRVTATVPVGTFPLAVAVSPDGTRVYVVNNASHTVSVLDTRQNRLLATIPVGTHPTAVAVRP